MPRTSPVKKDKFKRNAEYVLNEFKTIVTPANIRRLIFFDAVDSERTLKDRSANVQNTTLSLSANALDQSVAGKARILNFNAVGDYWEFADSDDLSFGNGTADSSFSIVACINPNSVNLEEIVSKWSEKTGATQREYAFEFNSSNQLDLYLADNSAGAYKSRRYTASLVGDVGSWHTYISTYDGSSTVAGIKLYRDGIKVDDSNYADSAGYVAMENKGTQVGNFTLSAAEVKTDVGNIKYAFIAIIAQELSQTQVTAIDYLLRKYVGVI